jgi:hypothetical protein
MLLFSLTNGPERICTFNIAFGRAAKASSV